MGGDVFIDPSQLEQVVVNLAVNARDAMPTGGLLAIKTSRLSLDGNAPPALDLSDGDYVVLSISDSGQGMSADIQTKIFEPFFTTKEVGKGTGLGLSTVYGILKQNNGGIAVYSHSEIGSTFKVFLPRVQPTGEPSSQSKELPEQQLSYAGTERILVVEDEDSVSRYVVKSLTREGYDVTLARNGAEALLLIDQNQGNFALLLTDVVMPGMNGKSLADQLTLKYPKLKTIFMSGYPQEIMTKHGVLQDDVSFFSINLLRLNNFWKKYDWCWIPENCTSG